MKEEVAKKETPYPSFIEASSCWLPLSWKKSREIKVKTTKKSRLSN
jgi:hypothetical protein